MPKKHVIEIDDEEPVELDLDPAMAEFIILKARAFDVKVPETDPDSGSDPTDDNDLDSLEDDPSDLTETELRDAIEGLTDTAKIELVALLWLGRGDYTRAEWAEAVAAATDREGEGNVADYVMGEPNAGDFLEDGLNQLGYEPEEYGPDSRLD